MTQDPKEARARATQLGRETFEKGYTPIISFRLDGGRRRFDVFRQHDGAKIATFSTGIYLGDFFDAYGIEKERAALQRTHNSPGTDHHRLALNRGRENG